MAKIELLPEELLVKTSEVDHAEWNYRPLLGLLQRTRFKLIVSLLNDLRDARILDIGYGSGVFFPQLANHGSSLYGIDIHDKNNEVSAALNEYGISATLVSGSISDTPFDDDFFDCAIAVSSLEYVPDIDIACAELVRILKPGGSLIVVTPGRSAILDAGLRLLGGEDADSNYGDRREKLIAAFDTHFQTKERKIWPPISLPGLTVYRAIRLQPR